MLISVRCAGGVVRATTTGGGLLRQREATELCTAIEAEAANCDGRPRLLFDLAALSRATPPAGWYAIRRLKALPVERIALVGANAFMRAFAGIVLRLGRFPQHRFFSDEAMALRWLADPSRA